MTTRMSKSTLASLAITFIIVLGYAVIGRHLLAHLQHQAVAARQSSQIQSDLFQRWYGAKQLLFHRINPYSDAVTTEIARADSLTTEHFATSTYAFAYPLYICFVIAPLTVLPFSAVIFLYTGFCFLLLAVTVFLLLRRLIPSCTSWAAALCAASMLFVLPIYSALSLQQPSLLVLDAMLLGLYLMLRRRYGWAGVALSAIIIKPQLGIPLLAFALFWSFAPGDRGRRGLAYGIIGGFVVLELLSQVFLPGWERNFIHAVNQYGSDQGVNPGLWIFTANRVAAVILAGLVVLLTLATWAWAWRHPNDDEAVLVAVGTTTLAMLLVSPRSGILYYDVLFVIIPALAVIRLVQRYSARLRTAALVILALAIFWPIISDAGPTRLQVVLRILMQPFKGTLAFFLTSPMETASHFYTVYVAPGLCVAIALLLVQRYQRDKTLPPGDRLPGMAS